MIFKRLLASLAIVSLALCAGLMVYWWRSNHGYSDQLMLGAAGSTQSHFLSNHGQVAIEIREAVPGGIRNEMHFYPFRQFIGYFLILPGLWLAIKVRSLLPRPGSGEKSEIRN